MATWRSCRACQARSDADIIAEVVAVIEEGVHRGNPQANVLVSDWGWRGHGDAPDIIARLPKSVWLMSVSEWEPADRARRDQDQGRRVLDLGGRTGAAGLPALGGRHGSRAEDGGRDPVQQHLRDRQRALSARHGPGGRALPQPGVGQAGRHADRLDDGRLSFAQLPACPAIEPRDLPPSVEAVLDARGPRAVWPRGSPPCTQGVDPAERRLPPVSVSHQRGLHLSGPMRSGESALSDEDRLQGDDVGHSLRRSRRLARPVPAGSVRRPVRKGRRRLAGGHCDRCKRPWKRRRPSGATRLMRICDWPGRQPSISSRLPTNRVLSSPAMRLPNLRTRCRPNSAIACGVK